MSYNNYFLGIIMDLWYWVTRKPGFCKHCMWICVKHPFSTWLYKRDLVRFRAALLRENPNHKLDEETTEALHWSFQTAYEDGKIFYALDICSEIKDWTGVDRYNYQSDTVITIPKMVKTAEEIAWSEKFHAFMNTPGAVWEDDDRGEPQ